MRAIAVHFVQELLISSHTEYLFTEKNLDGDCVLDIIAEQENTELMMLEQVQSVVQNLWEGPFEIDTPLTKFSKTSAVMLSFYTNGTTVDKERALRWQPYTQAPQSWLTFEVWRQGFKTRYFIEAVFIFVLTILLQH